MQSVKDTSVVSAGMSLVFWVDGPVHEVRDNDTIPMQIPATVTLLIERFLEISRSKYINSLSHAGHVPSQLSSW